MIIGTSDPMYIKAVLFDYICDKPGFRIDEANPFELIDDIKYLYPEFDVDQVVSRAFEDNITVPEAVNILRDEHEAM